jgi:hypothetical protein
MPMDAIGYLIVFAAVGFVGALMMKPATRRTGSANKTVSRERAASRAGGQAKGHSTSPNVEFRGDT